MIELHDVSLGWDEGSSGHVTVLDHVNLQVRPREIVSLVGHNGSGKSTLGRIIMGSTAASSGSVVIDGCDLGTAEGMDRARGLVGLVMQSPEDQIVSTMVGDEVAFGPKNLDLAPDEIERRVTAALAAVGLEGARDRDVEAMSGGEQQRLAIASMLAMEPRYLVLDEATSQLDSAARPAFRALIRRLRDERGCGIVLITHDPIEIAMADRVVELDQGRVRWQGAPERFFAERAGDADAVVAGAYVQELHEAVVGGYSLKAGVEPHELASWLSEAPQALRARILDVVAPQQGACACSFEPAGDQEERLSVSGVTYAYGSHDALRGVDMHLAAGEVYLVAGATGSGKSTLATIVAGLVDPERGEVRVSGVAPRPGQVGLVFQDPERQLFAERVRDELAFAPRNLGLQDEDVEERIAGAAEAVGLDPELLERDPFSLSGGQARRVALGSVLAMRPELLVLDEPTSGLDAVGRRALHGMVSDLASRGVSIIVVSHDLEEWLDQAAHVLLLRDGAVAWSGAVGELRRSPEAFRAAGLLAPEAWRLSWELAHPDRAPEVPSDRMPPVRPIPQERRPYLAGVDARVKIGVLLAFTVAVFAAGSPVALVGWAAFACLSLAAANMGVGRALAALKPALVLFALIVVANLFTIDGTAPIPLVGPVGITVAGAGRALMAVARIALLLVVATAVSATSTPTELADGCVRLLKPLGRLGAPVGAVGLTLSLALRFIPITQREMSRIVLAQRSRAARFDEGGVVRRVRMWCGVLVPAVVSLFRRADRIAESMDARGYTAEANHEPPRKPLEARDRLVLAVSLVVLAGVLVWSYIW